MQGTRSIADEIVHGSVAIDGLLTCHASFGVGCLRIASGSATCAQCREGAQNECCVNCFIGHCSTTFQPTLLSGVD